MVPVARAMGLVDLHCHPLPGIDDGVRSADEGVALLVALARAGFDVAVATPHVRAGLWDNRLDTRAAAHAALGDALAAARGRGEPLPELLLAGEHLFDDVLQDLLSRGEALTYPGGGAALVEFQYEFVPVRVELQLWRMQKSGVRPVLAHPERYAPLQADTERYEDILGAGAWGLLDVMSLVGAYGRRAQAAAERNLDKGLYVAACTDAHKPDDVTEVERALEALRVRVGDEGVRRLLDDGPRRVLAAARREAPAA